MWVTPRTRRATRGGRARGRGRAARRGARLIALRASPSNQAAVSQSSHNQPPVVPPRRRRSSSERSSEPSLVLRSRLAPASITDAAAGRGARRPLGGRKRSHHEGGSTPDIPTRVIWRDSLAVCPRRRHRLSRAHSVRRATARDRARRGCARRALTDGITAMALTTIHRSWRGDGPLCQGLVAPRWRVGPYARPARAAAARAAEAARSAPQVDVGVRSREQPEGVRDEPRAGEQ